MTDWFARPVPGGHFRAEDLSQRFPAMDIESFQSIFCLELFRPFRP